MLRPTHTSYQGSSYVPRAYSASAGCHPILVQFMQRLTHKPPTLTETKSLGSFESDVTSAVNTTSAENVAVSSSHRADREVVSYISSLLAQGYQNLHHEFQSILISR